jgi:hypothetical protein
MVFPPYRLENEWLAAAGGFTWYSAHSFQRGDAPRPSLPGRHDFNQLDHRHEYFAPAYWRHCSHAASSGEPVKQDFTGDPTEERVLTSIAENVDNQTLTPLQPQRPDDGNQNTDFPSCQFVNHIYCQYLNPIPNYAGRIRATGLTDFDIVYDVAVCRSNRLRRRKAHVGRVLVWTGFMEGSDADRKTLGHQRIKSYKK